MDDVEPENNLFTNTRAATTAQAVNITFDPDCCWTASAHAEIAMLRTTTFPGKF